MQYNPGPCPPPTDHEVSFWERSCAGMTAYRGMVDMYIIWTTRLDPQVASDLPKQP
jgi:hypothetical protein